MAVGEFLELFVALLCTVGCESGPSSVERSPEEVEEGEEDKAIADNGGNIGAAGDKGEVDGWETPSATLPCRSCSCPTLLPRSNSSAVASTAGAILPMPCNCNRESSVAPPPTPPAEPDMARMRSCSCSRADLRVVNGVPVVSRFSRGHNCQPNAALSHQRSKTSLRIPACSNSGTLEILSCPKSFLKYAALVSIPVQSCRLMGMIGSAMSFWVA